MQEKQGQDDSPSVQVHEVVRDILSAIRAVKLYPPNNPVYSQSITKSYRNLEKQLELESVFHLGVQKSGIWHDQASMERDLRLSKGLSADLFSKGVRQVSFSRGLTESELQNFYTIISLSKEEISLKGGLGALLWDRGITHIQVRETDLQGELPDFGKGQALGVDAGGVKGPSDQIKNELSRKSITVQDVAYSLSDLVRKPEEFGAVVMKQSETRSDSNERREERLLQIYRDVGRQILETSHEQREFLFQSLAQSVLSLPAAERDELVGRRLFPEADRQMLQLRPNLDQEQVPDAIHELLTARFPRVWTVSQVSSLLQSVSSARTELPPSAEPAALPSDLPAISRELTDYSSEEIEAIRTIAESTREGEMVRPFLTTLIQLIPWVLNPDPSTTSENAVLIFSRIIGMLEEMISLLIEKQDYGMAVKVLYVFRRPVEPQFRPSLSATLKKACNKKRMAYLIRVLRSLPKDSPDYSAIITFFSILDRNATPILLEMLAEEEDRTIRRILIHILKDLGKNQIAFLGRLLSDGRWFFVRNIVSILGESRKEEAIDFLETVAGHQHFQIRQEVLKALVMIGGMKAADLISKFINDPDIDIRFMAIRSLGTLCVPGGRGEQALIKFLKKMFMRRINQELRLEAIESLGKIGSRESLPFLKKFARIRWWLPRKPRIELQKRADRAMTEIRRRMGDA